jgi:hypothetical protein
LRVWHPSTEQHIQLNEPKDEIEWRSRYGLSVGEITLVEEHAREFNRSLAFLVLLKTFQNTGYFCDLQNVPVQIINYIREQLLNNGSGAEWTRLKALPGNPTPGNMHEVSEHYRWLMTLGEIKGLLAPIPAAKVMHFANETLSLRPMELRLRRMSGAKRNTLVLCAIERARIDMRDALGDMICKRVATMTADAKEDLDRMRESLLSINDKIVSISGQSPKTIRCHCAIGKGLKQNDDTYRALRQLKARSTTGVFLWDRKTFVCGFCERTDMGRITHPYDLPDKLVAVPMAGIQLGGERLALANTLATRLATIQTSQQTTHTHDVQVNPLAAAPCICRPAQAGADHI